MQSAPPLIEFQRPFSVPRPRLALGLGVFDGVHIGHQEIIRRLAEIAAQNQAIPCAVSFFPHPREITAASGPQMLLPLATRLEYLKNAGAANCGLINFNADLAAVPPGKFLQRLLNDRNFELAAICVGKNWRFGQKGSGGAADIASFGQKYAVECAAVPEVSYHGRLVSSSAIRELIEIGDLTTAGAMLNRPVQLFGCVEHGLEVAAARLETPTANLRKSAGILPPDGVYAGKVAIDGRSYAAAVNIGLAPTFAVNRRRVEIHLLDWHGDLYGRNLVLNLIKFIRPEKTFSDAAELKRQIGADIAAVRQIIFDSFTKE